MQQACALCVCVCVCVSVCLWSLLSIYSHWWKVPHTLIPRVKSSQYCIYYHYRCENVSVGVCVCVRVCMLLWQTICHNVAFALCWLSCLWDHQYRSKVIVPDQWENLRKLTLPSVVHSMPSVGQNWKYHTNWLCP